MLGSKQRLVVMRGDVRRPAAREVYVRLRRVTARWDHVRDHGAAVRSAGRRGSRGSDARGFRFSINAALRWAGAAL